MASFRPAFPEATIRLDKDIKVFLLFLKPAAVFDSPHMMLDSSVAPHVLTTLVDRTANGLMIADSVIPSRPEAQSICVGSFRDISGGVFDQC